jgi:hypothetical protein
MGENKEFTLAVSVLENAPPVMKLKDFQPFFFW